MAYSYTQKGNCDMEKIKGGQQRGKGDWKTRNLEELKVEWPSSSNVKEEFMFKDKMKGKKSFLSVPRFL